MPRTRREVLKATAAVAAASQLPSAFGATTSPIPRRKAGKTGLDVSAIGVGGYHLGSIKDEKESTALVHRALDEGINFFDNAWDYHDGESEKRLGVALKDRRQKAIVMTKVCTHGRDKKTAIKMLHESLDRLKTDYLDVWQIHEVIYDNDPELIFASNGVVEALVEAKKQGKVRFVGFTGHKDPAIHLEMLNRGFDFDTVQMPLNAFDGQFRSFAEKVLPAAVEKQMAVFGMKSMSGSGEPVARGVVSPEEALRYAMSLPVSTTVSGMDGIWVLEQNLAVAKGFTPMSAAEMKALRDRVAPLAGDGRFEQYKTTMKYDGGEGRKQHHLPKPEELPL